MMRFARPSPVRVRRRDGERGQGLFEWGAIVVFIAIVVIVVLQVLGRSVSSALCKTNQALSGSCAIYAANNGTNSLIKYQPNANGNASPGGTITGALTGISGARGMALDSSQNLWVANSTANSGVGSVTKYSSSVTGTTNVAPSATIGGGSTALNVPYGLAFDKGGDLWVANRTGNSVTEYLAATLAAGGNIVSAPNITISGPGTGLSAPVAIAFDSVGNIWVASNTGGTGNGVVDEYTTASLVAGNNNASPAFQLTSAQSISTPNGLAFNSAGTLFVSNTGTPAILEWASAKLSGAASAPTVNFVGPAELLNSPRDIAIDGSNDLWVMNQGNNSITEYLAGVVATANSAPAITISGANTGLNSPIGIAVG